MSITQAMPTYDYQCKACGHEFELFQQMSDAVKRKCPKCGKPRLERLIGIGAGVLFKGGGFYETDYRSDSYTKAAEAEKKAAEPASASKPADAKAGDSKSSDSKANAPETKAEAKSAATPAESKAARRTVVPSSAKKRQPAKRRK